MAEYIIDQEKMPSVARDLIMRELDETAKVVRCGDCEHFKSKQGIVGYCTVRGVQVLTLVTAGGYCNYGSNREGLVEE